jgi:molecular chaperone GrpE
MPDYSTSDSCDRPNAKPSNPASTSTTTEDVAWLRDRAELAEMERDKYRERLQRSSAEFENSRKRMQREFTEECRYAHSGLARQLLPILDNLQQALDASTKTSEIGSIIDGVRIVQSQLLHTLGQFNIDPIHALGEPFDPNVHEAVLEDPRTDVAPGTITQIVQPGYRVHERTLRPAKVAVAIEPRG